MGWSLSTALTLGRVSNLPTVWSNTLAGVVLAGASPFNWNIATLLLAMSLAYIGGMFLNDAFDRRIDATERPQRPIPAGKIKAADVFAAGTTLLVASILLTALAAYGWGNRLLPATLLAITLCFFIVLYDSWHKNNPLSPLIMGMCRVLVYLCAAFTAHPDPSYMVYIGALMLLAWLIGLTFVAKQENLSQIQSLWPVALLLVPLLSGVYFSVVDNQVWLAVVPTALWLGWCIYLLVRKQPGHVPLAVVSMIAGISLIDAILIATTSSLTITAAAIFAFCLTLLLQRFVSGT